MIFACRTGSRRAFGALAEAVAAVPVTEIGVIITSSPLPDPQLVLPNRYTVIGLRDIAAVHDDRIVINRDRIAAYIRMLRGDQHEFRKGGGAPSKRDLTIGAYDRRRQRGEPILSDLAEARAIISELAKSHPDREAPGVSTVRRHLGKLRSSGS